MAANDTTIDSDELSDVTAPYVHTEMYITHIF